ncbi:MAG TPA: hypothetical protein PLM33_12180 [Acidobacteriota bacterium]|nr:hypothetical protein [Acidobacteriota bacterium]HRV09094.1 hypothetical protein [Acidobacteriota bacterium]
MTQPLAFLQGELEAVLRVVRPFQVRDARFLELGFTLDDDPPDSVRHIRVGDNLVYANPQPGDKVRMLFALGNVLRVIKSQ